MQMQMNSSPVSWWRQWYQRLVRFEAVLDETYDSLQDRRIDELERRVARLENETLRARD